jgi:thioredoxin-related protein
MKLRFFYLTLIFLSLVGVSAQAAKVEGVGQFEIPGWFKQSFLDLRDDVAEAKTDNKRLFIYFHQDGCPYCAELVNNNFSQKHIADYMRKHFDSLDINMWGSKEVTDVDGKVYTEKTFAAANKVWFTPTILFFDETGKVVLRLNGYLPPHQFKTALEYVATRQENKLTFRDYYAKRSPVKSAGKLHDEPFFMKPPLNLSGLGNKKPLAVFFEQKDCAGCDRLHSKIFPHPMTQDQIKRYDVVQLDMWSKTSVVTPDGKKTNAKAWAKKLGVTYAPTAVIFHENKEVIRIEALLKAFHVQSVMDYVASESYKTQPSLQRFIDARAEHLIEKGHKVDLWK